MTDTRRSYLRGASRFECSPSWIADTPDVSEHLRLITVPGGFNYATS